MITKSSRYLLGLLLALLPAAICAQYTQPSQTENGESGQASYADLIKNSNNNKKKGKTAKYPSLRDQYEQNLQKRRIQRIDRSEMNATFIPKGLWMCGATVNYREWENENENLLVLKNLNMEGYIFSISPYVGYFLRNNLAVGVRYNYSRYYFFLGNLDLKFGDGLTIEDKGEDILSNSNFELNLKDLYYLENKHEVSAFMRYYMPLFGSKILGAFAEVRGTYSHANGRNSTGRRTENLNTLDGTYETVNKIQLGVTPGLCIFVTNFAAVETSIGVLGVDYRWSSFKNLHPNATEYEYGKNHSGGVNFKFNIFTINLGMTFYL